MSVSTGKLRLGPLPKIATVKVTITLTDHERVMLALLSRPIF